MQKKKGTLTLLLLGSNIPILKSHTQQRPIIQVKVKGDEPSLWSFAHPCTCNTILCDSFISFLELCFLSPTNKCTLFPSPLAPFLLMNILSSWDLALSQFSLAFNDSGFRCTETPVRPLHLIWRKQPCTDFSQADIPLHHFIQLYRADEWRCRKGGIPYKVFLVSEDKSQITWISGRDRRAVLQCHPFPRERRDEERLNHSISILSPSLPRFMWFTTTRGK